jgi:hypothetical protein
MISIPEIVPERPPPTTPRLRQIPRPSSTMFRSNTDSSMYSNDCDDDNRPTAAAYLGTGGSPTPKSRAISRLASSSAYDSRAATSNDMADIFDDEQPSIAAYMSRGRQSTGSRDSLVTPSPMFGKHRWSAPAVQPPKMADLVPSGVDQSPRTVYRANGEVVREAAQDARKDAFEARVRAFAETVRNHIASVERFRLKVIDGQAAVQWVGVGEKVAGPS